jgi:hypothetical protein
VPTLLELQRALAAHVVDGEGPALDAWISLPPGADPAARIAVYSAGYPARVTEALHESFPALAKILGDNAFAELSDRYRDVLRAEPRNLNDVGVDLPRFLRTDPASESLPFLPDLAALEWALTRSFHAAVTQRFDPKECSDWTLEDWPRARLDFQPGLALLRSRWPLRALHATREQERAEIDVDLEQGGESVLVFRRGYEVAVEAVTEREAIAIEAFLAGRTLGEVSELLARADAADDEVVALFQRWVSLELVASVTLAA